MWCIKRNRTLLVTVFLLISRKLRSGVHGQLLIHMCLALLGLFMSFIISSLLGRYYGDLNFDVREPFCIGFSALVHYFFLVYFLITAAQSILLYLKLVKVLGTSDLLNQYTLKVGIISWSEFQDYTQYYSANTLIQVWKGW